MIRKNVETDGDLTVAFRREPSLSKKIYDPDTKIEIECTNRDMPRGKERIFIFVDNRRAFEFDVHVGFSSDNREVIFCASRDKVQTGFDSAKTKLIMFETYQQFVEMLRSEFQLLIFGDIPAGAIATFKLV